MSQVPNTIDEDDSIEIREVWDHNLEEEMKLIEEAIDNHPYVAMDTEFPGTVCKSLKVNPNPNVKPKPYDFTYETVKLNVNMLKLIQLGLTLSDEQGNLPSFGSKKHCVWQFNFKEFDLESDMYNEDSIKLLKNSGIDFDKNKELGIEAKRFGRLVMSSGVVLNDDVQWVTYHCGYDFGYFLKLLTGQDLPEKESDFYILVDKFFPIVYDIRHLMENIYELYGPLKTVAELLKVKRVGTSHQAGSDSLLTWGVFNQIRHKYFNGSMDKKEHSGYLFGLDNRLRINN